MADLPVQKTFVGYSEVMTETQKDELDRQRRMERLLNDLLNNIAVMKLDIESIKAHMSIVTGEEKL